MVIKAFAGIINQDPTLKTLTGVARFVYALMDLSKRIGLD